MPRRDPGLEDTTREVAALLTEASLRLLLGQTGVDFPDREPSCDGLLIPCKMRPSTSMRRSIAGYRATRFPQGVQPVFQPLTGHRFDLYVSCDSGFAHSLNQASTSALKAEIYIIPLGGRFP